MAARHLQRRFTVVQKLQPSAGKNSTRKIDAKSQNASTVTSPMRAYTGFLVLFWQIVRSGIAFVRHKGGEEGVKPAKLAYLH